MPIRPEDAPENSGDRKFEEWCKWGGCPVGERCGLAQVVESMEKTEARLIVSMFGDENDIEHHPGALTKIDRAYTQARTWMKALGIIGIMAGLIFHGIDDRLKEQELKIDQMQKSLIDVLQQLKLKGTISTERPFIAHQDERQELSNDSSIEEGK